MRRLAILLILASPAAADEILRIPPTSTVAGLPTCDSSRDGLIRSVTDGTSSTDCSTGGGAATALCQCDGSAWGSVRDGSGASDHGALTGLSDDDHPQYLLATEVDTEAELEALLGDVTNVLTDSETAATATALAANGSNCSSGNAPLGVDASGAVEGCFDVATEAELTTHTANASAHHTATVDTGPSPDCSGTLTYQDGEGNCDTYTLGGNTTSLATTSGTLTSGDCVEFDASGNLVASGAGCGGGSSTSLTDADGDTLVQVEEGADDDTFRVDTAAGQRFTIGATGTANFTPDGTNNFATISDNGSSHQLLLEAANPQTGRALLSLENAAGTEVASFDTETPRLTIGYAGTVAPELRLHKGSGSSAKIELLDQVSGRSLDIEYNTDEEAIFDNSCNTVNCDFSFRTNGSERLEIDNGGTVTFKPDGSTSALVVSTSGVDTTNSGIVRDVNTYSANQTLGVSDHIVLVDTDAVTITLPTCVGATGREYQIKNVAGSGSTVTIDANGTETIDRSLTQTLTDLQAVTVRCDGTEWWIF